MKSIGATSNHARLRSHQGVAPVGALVCSRATVLAAISTTMTPLAIGHLRRVAAEIPTPIPSPGAPGEGVAECGKDLAYDSRTPSRTMRSRISWLERVMASSPLV